jgi:2-succinyl-5-enolpyruvyl-6-hydroxy-3-cyclohexene-1-carboxylate synthase
MKEYFNKNINSFWGYLIVEELTRNRITYFCISPGSRSTPLTLAAAVHPKIKTTVFFDERNASYHAAGYAKATNLPAVIICTSGTAVANCLPAIIEAACDMIPMIILSADRPPELRQTGANQTIDQVKIFNHYVKWQFDLPCPTEEITPASVLTTIDQAIHQATTIPQGPVHINCMFREPLDPTAKKITIAYQQLVSKWFHDQNPYTYYKESHPGLSFPFYQEITLKINKIKKGLLVVGRLKSKEEKNMVKKLAKKLAWPVWADLLSGLRCCNNTTFLISYFDQILLSDFICNQIKPEIILHLGGQLISKRFYHFLAKYYDKEYIVIKDHPYRYDPERKVTAHFQCSLVHFCQNIIPYLRGNSDHFWFKQQKKYDLKIEKKIAGFISRSKQLNEISTAIIISKHTPPGYGLFLANSMPIRDMDMYAAFNSTETHTAANRGASGIDGNIGSASGFASGLNKPVTLVIGDLALLHDLNSLAILSSQKVPVIIIAINNHGGGIFSFFPIANYPEICKKYFTAAHHFKFEFIAKMFGLEYFQPKNNMELIKLYKKCVKQNKSSLIEIDLNQKINFKLHNKLQKAIIKVIEEKS